MLGWNWRVAGALVGALCLVSLAMSAVAAGVESGPVITALHNGGGPAPGGTVVTISGERFTGATAVNFGPNPATSFNVVKDGKITATSPEGHGNVDIRVITPAGESPLTPKDVFHYTVYTVSSVAPKNGPAGTQVLITGTGFHEVEQVFFGSQPASSFEIVNGLEIKAIAPAGAAGKVAVTVSGPRGTSEVGKEDFFKYGKPSVTSVTPSSGALAGGGTVTVTGTGFAVGSGTEFLFGKALAGGVDCSSSTSCEMTVPAAAKAGTVDVLARVGTFKSKKSAGDHYTYE